MKKLLWHESLLVLLLIFLFTGLVEAQEVGTSELDAAVKDMRNFDMQKFEALKSSNYAEARKMWGKRTADTIKAWAIIESKGDAGIVRIKQELDTIDKNNEKDDLFKLNAAALLWKIGQLNEAETIGQIWQTTPLHLDYNYVFYTAFQAAKTQDERALPMLLPLLRDDKGGTLIADHAMEVRWPLTSEFIWGAFGNKGIPALMNILQKSENQVEIACAIGFLSRVHHMEALPRIRQIALDGQGLAKQWAVRGLGIFGHPDDFDTLISGLKTSSSEVDQYTYLWALYEYGDSRAVSCIIPYLNNDKSKVRLEAASALQALVTVEGLDAIAGFYKNAKTSQDRQAGYGLVNYLQKQNFTVDSYLNLSMEKKQQIVASILSKRNLRETSKKLSHDEFVAITQKWKNEHQITNPALSIGDILAVATIDDIPLLNDVKASLYYRLSDECIGEAQVISSVVSDLGRKRYGR